MSKNGTWIILVGNLVFITAVVTVSATLIGLYINDVATPPVSFVDKQYAPDNSSVCPSDIIILQPEIEVNKVPVIAQVVHSWWSVKDAMTAKFEGQTLYTIYTETGEFSRLWSVTVPDLPPGIYELRIGIQDNYYRKGSVTSIVFNVPEYC